MCPGFVFVAVVVVLWLWLLGVLGEIMFAWLSSFGFVKRRLLSCFFHSEVSPFVLDFSIFCSL